MTCNAGQIACPHCGVRHAARCPPEVKGKPDILPLITRPNLPLMSDLRWCKGPAATRIVAVHKYTPYEVTHFRVISPKLVEFVLLGRNYFEDARWNSAKKCYEADDRHQGPTELMVQTATDGNVLMEQVPEWRPAAHQLGQWVIEGRQGSGLVQKGQLLPEGDCVLSARAGDGSNAARVEVCGSRTHIEVLREGWTPIREERFWTPLQHVLTSVEDIWDRRWWDWAERNKEEEDE